METTTDMKEEEHDIAAKEVAEETLASLPKEEEKEEKKEEKAYKPKR